MTSQEYLKAWYEEQNLSNRVFKSEFVNGDGVLVYGKVITYPATVEEWVANDCKMEEPENYLQPVK